MMKTLNYYDSINSPDGFVGARIFESKIDFYFPLGVKFQAANSTTCLKQAYQVLSVISSAAASTKCSTYSQDNHKKSSDPFNSYFWLLKDYFKNGLYSLKRKQLIENYNGKIHWKKTFNQIPYVKDQSLVFLRPVAEKLSSTDSIITVIHKYCLKQSLKQVGWLFSIEDNEPSLHLSEPEKIYFQHVLIKELRHTFEDRRKLLLQHLLRVIEHSIGLQHFLDRSELGTYEFHQVWENMIQTVYGNLPVDQFFPSATWHLESYGSIKSSNLKPDTVLEYDHTLYILDAKYYKYGVLSDRPTSTLPTSDSIQKQITYGDHAALKMGHRFPGGIRNAFIVPFCAKPDEDHIKYAGYAITNWRENNPADNSDYRKVHLLLVDTDYLMQTYQTRQQSPELTHYLIRHIPA